MNRKSLIARLIGSSRGQALVEFGMVLPLLLIVGFAITEFGRALWVQNVLTEAAGAGARAACQATVDTYQAKAEAAANRILDANKMGTGMPGGTTVTATLYDVPDGQQGVWVRVSRDFNFIPGNAGKGDGLSAAPFGATKDKIVFGTFTVAGESRMAILDIFWGG